MVVVFAAGGPSDTIARVLAERMRQPLGQTVIVENTVGAAGTIGVARQVRAAPDGYTLGIGHWGTHVVNGAVYPLPYDLLKDLEPVALVTTNPQVLVARSGVPAKDLKELIAWVKANDGKVTAGTAGAGAASHISGIYFGNSIGASLSFIPYKGTGPAMQDLVGGQIDIMFDQAATALAQVGTAASRRSPSRRRRALRRRRTSRRWTRPACRGCTSRSGMRSGCRAARRRTIIARLNGAIVEALADPNVQKRLGDIGQDIPPREQQTPEALAAFHKAEIEKWWPLIKAAKVKVE